MFDRLGPFTLLIPWGFTQKKLDFIIIFQVFFFFPFGISRGIISYSSIYCELVIWSILPKKFMLKEWPEWPMITIK